MSADRQRLTSAIRRIAKTDPAIRDLLKAADNKGGKPGSAGVGSSTDAESQRICCDGSVSDNANPGVEDRDPDADGTGQDGGLNSDDPAKLDMGEGTLSGVTDCATGQPICFEGSDWIPPDDWEDAQTPPVDETFEQGYYWVRYGKIFGPLCCTAAFTESGTLAAQDAHCDGQTAPLTARRECGTPFLGVDCSPDNCFNPDPSEYTVDSWPEDGCVNLAVKGGKLVGSKYDPENDGSYNAPRTSIDLCSGGDQTSLAPAANGGWKTINSTTNNGYLYDSSGNQIAHIDGNEYSDPTI